MLSSTVPSLVGAGLVLVLGWGLASLVGRGVALLLGDADFEPWARSGSIAVVRLMTLFAALELVGWLTPVSVGLAMLIVGWLALQPDRRSLAHAAPRWTERPADRPRIETGPVLAEDGRPVRSAYDRRRLSRPGQDRRAADGTRAAS